MKELKADEFFSQRAESSPYGRVARDALAAGATLYVSDRAGPAANLLDTYTVRLQLLQTRAITDHARRLVEDLREVCAALTSNPERAVMFVVVTAKSGETYIFFVDAVTHEVIASVASYSATLISAEDYFRIWGRERGW